MAYIRLWYLFLEPNWLVVSGWLLQKVPVVKQLANTQSSTVIAHLKSVFEEHGSPSKFVTDNGPQHSSASFREFSHTYGFTHVTSSPLYPQCNDLSERTVPTVKNVLQSVRNPARTLTWPCFVFVAPHCLMTYHRLPSFWMAKCIRQTFQQSLSLLPLLIETLMSSFNSDRMNDNFIYTRLKTSV